jgi:hypothetical protein
VENGKLVGLTNVGHRREFGCRGKWPCRSCHDPHRKFSTSIRSLPC